ncbi:MAG: hypothetical protein DRJ60_05830 [Thermoprotei archaeon]|nr:MAG: hypothetical protein DRJ60_05830 [Thermoprotei archaeon]
MSKRIVVALALSMFVISTSMGIANPIVPIYAEKLGATYTDLGLIGVAWSAPYCIFPILAGMWSDKIGRLKSFLIGVITSTIVPLLFLFSATPLHIALIRLFHGFGMSFLWAPGEALISDVTSEEERTRYLGFFNASWAMGFFLGPMISALIVDQAGYFGVFWASFIVGVFSAPILLLAGGDIKAKYATRGNVLRQIEKAVVRGLPFYMVITASSIVLAIIYSIYPAYLSNLTLSDAEISTIIGVIAATRALGFWSMGLMPKLNERRIIALGLTLQIIASILVIGAYDYLSVALVVALIGYAAGIQIPSATSMISRILKHEVGLSLGVMEAMFGIGWVIGPGVGGFLADYTSWSGAPYIFMGLVSIVSLVYFVLARSHVES